MLKLNDFVDLGLVINGSLFPDDPVQLLSSVKALLENVVVEALQKTNHFNNEHEYSSIEGMVYIDVTAKVGRFTCIKGPCYIGPGAEIRHGVNLSGNVYIGKDVIVGHGTEIKNSILFDGAEVTHGNYIINSILGREAKLGAGTKVSNTVLKFGSLIPVGRSEELVSEEISSLTLVDKDRQVTVASREFGIIAGDGVRTGANSILEVGSLLYPNVVLSSGEHFWGTKCL